MYKVLVISHSNLCKGFSDAVQMILGKDSQIAYLGLDEDGGDIFHKNLKKMIMELRNQENEVLILADLFGGSPFNKALFEACQDEKVKVISGVNLPMVIEAVMNEKSNLDKVVFQIAQSSKDSIKQGDILKNINLENE